MFDARTISVWRFYRITTFLFQRGPQYLQADTPAMQFSVDNVGIVY